ncbi:unnamed protein product [Phytomonas sp. EM1]|nr:unnamed protein product [Phytomonas sp. EM1]|eukprot:CCW64917.1 unnamed protein product [Phytomonas sp. isolate EM1]
MNCVVLSTVGKPMYRRAIWIATSWSPSMIIVQPLRNYSNFATTKCLTASLKSRPKTVYLSYRASALSLKWLPTHATNTSYRLLCSGMEAIGIAKQEEEDPNAVHDIISKRSYQAVCPDKANFAQNGYDDDEDQDAAMATYEEFLLSMNEASSALSESASMPSAAAGPTESGAGEVTVTEAVRAIVSEAVALLPEDGRSIRLTDLTPLLDVEAINKLSGGGSVLSFLQSFPDVFTVSASEGQGVSGGGLGVGSGRRWYVSRLKPIKSPAGAIPSADGGSGALTMKLNDLADLYTEEELRALIRPASRSVAGTCQEERLSTSTAPSRTAKCGQRHALQPVNDPADGHVSSISTPDWGLLAAALPPSKPLPVTQVMREVAPEEFLLQVKSSGKGLIRLFHEQYEVARHHVMLSAENSLLARAGELHDVAAWAPDVAAEQLMKSNDLGVSSWVGDLLLDEEEEVSASDSFVEDEEDVPTETGQDAAAWAATTVHWPNVFYDGLSAPQKKSPGTSSARASTKSKKSPKSSKAPAIRLTTPADSPVDSAKPIYKSDKAHSESQVKERAAACRSSCEGRPKNPQELQEAHTELAIQRGWRTPLEMLDFFVECFPTFFVPVPELVPTDALARILGPRNTISHVVKVYSYFFEYDKNNNHARLAPSLQHPRIGQANVHYAKWDPQRLTGGPDTRHGSASRLTARPCGVTLQGTAATNAFPILKPIIRSAHGASNPNPLVAKNRHAFNTAQGSTAASSLALSGVPRSSIFSGIEHVDHLQSLHTLLKIINIIPYAKFVSLIEAAEQAGVTAAEFEGIIQADGETFTNANAHHHLFLTVSLSEGDGGRMVRLRPYWLAPNSLGDLKAEDLPVKVSSALRPTWTSINKFLSKIPEDSQAQLLQLKVRDQIDCGDIDGSEQNERNHLQQIMGCLRLAGRCCWVDVDGMRVRRYTANADLDDFTHIIVDLLSHFATHVLEPVDVILDRADTSLSALSHTEKDMTRGEGGLTALCRHALQSRREEFVEFLQSHKRVLEVSAADDGRNICVRRKTSFVSFVSGN